MSFSIVGTALSFAWPDGTVVFDRLDLAIGPGTTGLIGANGSGKSTLLRLIAGELRPQSGTIRADGDVGYLPQDLTLGVQATVSDLLGVTAVRRALHAIEAGSVDEADFTAVGDDWDVEERVAAELSRLALDHLDLDAPVGQLSGGETVLLHLAALFLRRPAVLLLDEPTNNLDREARHRLYAAVEAWSGVTLVVSHDRELLERVDQIADLSGGGTGPGGGLRMFGGNFPAYAGNPRGRTGGRGPRRPVRGRRRPPAAPRPDRHPVQAGPARALRAPAAGGRRPAPHRHERQEAQRAGVRGQAPQHPGGAALRGPGPAETRPGTRPARTPRSASSCPAPPYRPAASSYPPAAWPAPPGAPAPAPLQTARPPSHHHLLTNSHRPRPHPRWTSSSSAARSGSRSPAPTGPARPPCCGRSPAWPSCPASPYAR